MEYLNRDRVERVSPESFQTRQPYPWETIEDILTPEGHERSARPCPIPRCSSAGWV